MKNPLFFIASIGLLYALGTSAGSFKYVGLSESGAEWGSNIPGVYYVDYIFPTTSSIDYYVSNGMNVFRLPFLWERLQPTLNGPFDPTYLGYINKTVQYVTVTKGVYILLDVHNYARYNNVILGEGVDYSSFQFLWNQLAGLYKNNPKVIFGLMNEPYGLPNENVYLSMQAAINGIRASGATQLITVPGNSWTGAHSWVSSGSSAVMANITDPLNNFMFEMHQYFDNNYSGNGACDPSFDPTTVFADATSWLRSQGKVGWLGEFGIENSPQCITILQNTMAYLNANSDVWQGLTWWAVGTWWTNYKFSLDSGVGDAQLAVLKNYMPSAAPVPVTPTSAPASTPAPTPVAPLTTAAPAVATTGRAKPITTSAVPTPTPTPVSTPVSPAPTPVVSPTPSSGSNSTCVTGNMKCVSTNTYSTCNWGAWASPQTCGINTICSPNGNYIYCVASSVPVISTPNSPSVVPTPAPLTTHAAAAAPTPTPTPTPVASLTTSQAAAASTSSSTCTLGQSRCTGTNTYQSCTNGRNGNVWAASQTCQKGLSCHAVANSVYCY